MASIASSTPGTLSGLLFRPLAGLAESCKDFRRCPSLPDPRWLELGVARVLHEVPSGRAFLQQVGPLLAGCPERSLLFETLRSTRRLRLCAQVAEGVATAVQGDAFAAYPALGQFDLYAADGHWHGAAVHDRAIDERKWAVGHFYTLNLRTGAAQWLASAQGKKEHDMHALKRQELEHLRRGAPKGRKVLYAYDAAGIDFAQWHRWKHTGGIYFVSVLKENMRLAVIGENPCERTDPINAGVEADELVATSQHVFVRRVTFRDPATGTLYVFLTNELTLAPGLIAFLYRRRWDLEKAFDEFKNKLGELRAWASSDTAKTMQAHLLCLAYNLTKIFEDHLARQHQVANHAEIRRARQRLDRIQAAAASPLPATVLAWFRLTQTSVKFYRWLRAFFLSPLPLEPLLAVLRASYSSL